MEQMRLQAIAPGRFGEEMLAIIHDPAAPEVLRDYAIQHLGQWCSPRGAALGQPSEQDPAIVRQTADSLAAIAADPTLSYTTIPGTSLMALADMKSGGTDPQVITPAIDSLRPWLAANLAGTANTAEITRISAINAVGLLRLETFAPAIRTLAADPATPPDLRLCASGSGVALQHFPREDLCASGSGVAIQIPRQFRCASGSGVALQHFPREDLNGV